MKNASMEKKMVTNTLVPSSRYLVRKDELTVVPALVRRSGPSEEEVREYLIENGGDINNPEDWLIARICLIAERYPPVRTRWH